MPKLICKNCYDEPALENGYCPLCYKTMTCKIKFCFEPKFKNRLCYKHHLKETAHKDLILYKNIDKGGDDDKKAVFLGIR